jgi:hypothetical protein
MGGIFIFGCFFSLCILYGMIFVSHKEIIRKKGETKNGYFYPIGVTYWSLSPFIYVKGGIS